MNGHPYREPGEVLCSPTWGATRWARLKVRAARWVGVLSLWKIDRLRAQRLAENERLHSRAVEMQAEVLENVQRLGVVVAVHERNSRSLERMTMAMHKRNERELDRALAAHERELEREPGGKT